MARPSEILTITPDVAAVEAARRELGGFRDQLPNVLTQAINKTLRDAMSAVATKMAETINVGRNNIRRRMSIVLATKKGGQQSGKLSIMSRRIGAINFAAKDLRPKRLRGSRDAGSGGGVRFQLYKGGVVTTLKHAFIAKGRVGSDGENANRQVFQRTRTGPKAKSGWVKRLQVKSVKGLSLATVYHDKPEFHALTVNTINGKLSQYIRSQTQYILSKGKQ